MQSVIMNEKSECLVVDSGGFIENVKLDDFGKKIFSVSAVVKEIKDKATRRRLQVLPYEIHFQEPSAASIAQVRKVATETGDLRSLSATDIKVIALTYDLTPSTSVPSSDREEEEDSNISVDDDQKTKMVMEDKDGKTEEGQEEGAEMEVQEEEEEEDDEEGWVTADNIATFDFQKQFQSAFPDEEVPVPPVSCLTTDFAMQNVLLKMQLGLRSVNGRAIRSVKSFVLWCYSCYKHTLDQSKFFCPKCGNKTLRKVSASVNPAGKLELHFAKKFQIRNKGLNRQTDSKFQGGKYSFNKIYSEDQPMPHQRPSKKSLQRDAMGDSVISSDCPFALRDLSSRAARLGINKGYRTRCRK